MQKVLIIKDHAEIMQISSENLALTLPGVSCHAMISGANALLPPASLGSELPKACVTQNRLFSSAILGNFNILRAPVTC